MSDTTVKTSEPVAELIDRLTSLRRDMDAWMQRDGANMGETTSTEAKVLKAQLTLEKAMRRRARAEAALCNLDALVVAARKEMKEAEHEQKVAFADLAAALYYDECPLNDEEGVGP